ncbi:39S ribosomal protein L38, mitochondrial-like isoform X2 [Acanthaster planci]|uniref:Large ribosomal subunit protein mL38 n=1 Tax=Acanthaster planci TaxID=133434 RepID=A0A8B8A3S0_ACAPL|nr:39S ribosomal protein L38, mitochondrial-like isoform X2 [Acanthaster planci]
MAAPMGNFCRQLLRISCLDISRASSMRRQMNIHQRPTTSCHSASAGIDIGLPHTPPSGKVVLKERLARNRQNKSNAELERAARHRTLQVPLDKVNEEWQRTSMPYHLRSVAHHYAIFRDLFDGADFLPQVVLKIDYGVTEDEAAPVYSGNFVTPTEASQPPAVTFESSEDTLWTMLLTNPDGHLLDNHKEYVHWLIGNIPGNQLSQGEEIFNYLPPFPAQGTGYHRFVFVLFQQEGRVDYSSRAVSLPCRKLRERTFETLEFYRQYQDMITPAGLGFFQSRWDSSVRETFHQTLGMREPIFEYDHPKLYIAEQKKWPHKKALQYLLKYMPKDKRAKIRGFWPNFPDRRLQDKQLRNTRSKGQE